MQVIEISGEVKFMKRFLRLTICLALLLQMPGLPPAMASSRSESEPESRHKSGTTTLIQATCLGAGVALIASGIIFEGKEMATRRMYVEGGNGGYVDVPVETGADTDSMFLVGAIFMGLALIFELLPEGSDLDDYELAGKGSQSTLMPQVRTTSLGDGSSAIGLAKSFW